MTQDNKDLTENRIPFGLLEPDVQKRMEEDTQYESRLVADQVSTIMQDLYPVSWAALMEGQTG